MTKPLRPLSRNTLKMIHRLAGALALLMISAFFTSSVIVDLIGDHSLIASVKQGILYCVGMLVVAMMATGISGAKLYPGKPKGGFAVKLKRMKIIAANGMLILLPAAVVLAYWSAAGQFDTVYWMVQAVELVAGATNATLLALNIRDGIRLAGGNKIKVKGI